MRFLARAALVPLSLATVAAAASAPARAPRELTVLVAATTDVHGHLEGWDYYSNRPDTARGLARAATIVDSLRAAAPGHVVLVDAGDTDDQCGHDAVAAHACSPAGVRMRSAAAVTIL